MAKKNTHTQNKKEKKFEKKMSSKLTKEHVEDFCKNGFVVIEDVLSDQEISVARKAFHDNLQSIGIDDDAIFAIQRNHLLP